MSRKCRKPFSNLCTHTSYEMGESRAAAHREQVRSISVWTTSVRRVECGRNIACIQQWHSHTHTRAGECALRTNIYNHRGP